MKKITLTVIGLFMMFSGLHSQEFTVLPNGFTNHGKDYIVIESKHDLKTLIDRVENTIRSKHQSPSIIVHQTQDHQLIVSDFLKGFTKSDKRSASLFLFDLSYKIVLDFKDGKIRINAPIILLGSQARFSNNTNSFSFAMGFSGKNSIRSNDEKKLYIYNEQGKLLEPSTKTKLEGLFNDLIRLVTEGVASQDAEW